MGSRAPTAPSIVPLSSPPSLALLLVLPPLCGCRTTAVLLGAAELDPAVAAAVRLLRYLCTQAHSLSPIDAALAFTLAAPNKVCTYVGVHDNGYNWQEALGLALCADNH